MKQQSDATTLSGAVVVVVGSDLWCWSLDCLWCEVDHKRWSIWSKMEQYHNQLIANHISKQKIIKLNDDDIYNCTKAVEADPNTIHLKVLLTSFIIIANVSNCLQTNISAYMSQYVNTFVTCKMTCTRHIMHVKYKDWPKTTICKHN